jgi:outer membrane protein
MVRRIRTGRAGAFLRGALVVALGGVLSALAEPAAAQSLTDALVMAYQNNPSLAAQRAKLRAQDEQVAQALAGWHPTVTINGSTGRQWYNAVTSSLASGTSTTEYPRSGSLTITQNLYKGGTIEAQTRVSDFLVMVERSRLQLVEQTTLLSASTAYINVVRDQAVLDLNINNEQVLTRQLEATRDRFAVGEVTRTDVSQAEARLSQAKADREAAQNQLQISRANYRNVVGMAPAHLIDPGEPKGLPGSQDEAMSLAQNQNPNVLVARYTERAALANVDVQFGGLLPTLSLQGVISKSTQQVSTADDTEVAQILAVLSMPIYTGGLVEAQVREAKQVVGQRRLELEQAQRQAIQDATTAWENLRSARAQIVSFQDQVRADEVALEGVQQEALAGLRTVLDVLNAEQELLSARVNLTKSHHDAIQSGYDLLNAVGRLTARDRQLPVEYYDPTTHYNTVRGKWFGVGDPAQ